MKGWRPFSWNTETWICHLVLSPWNVSFVHKPSLFPDPFLPLVFGLCSLSTVCLSTNGSLCPIWHFLSFTSQRNPCPWSVLDSNQPRCLWTLLFTDLPLLPSWSLSCTRTDLFCLLSLYLWCFSISFTVVILFDFFSFMYCCPLLRNFCYYIFIFLKKFLLILKENLIIQFLTFSLSSIPLPSPLLLTRGFIL